jgi:plastocyanin
VSRAKNGQLDKNVLIINPKNNGVKNVVVWLRPDSKERSATLKPEEINPALAKAAPKNHVVDQPCCQFEPRVLAVRVGDTLEVKNSAAINHNIKYDGPDSFNVNLPPGMSFKKPLPFQESRVPIPFSCSIHPWMAGRIRVFDQPYFAVTDANGDFEIKDAPAGKYNLVYWHELGFHKGRDGILGFTEELKGPVTNVKPIELELPQ